MDMFATAQNAQLPRECEFQINISVHRQIFKFNHKRYLASECQGCYICEDLQMSLHEVQVHRSASEDISECKDRFLSLLPKMTLRIQDH